MHPMLMAGVGGAAGAMLRYGLGGLVQHRLGASGFPAGTLAVNLLGCLAMGMLDTLVESRSLLSPDLRLLLGVGVLGGFTTFSAFGHETLALFRQGQATLAAANVAANVVLGLGAVALGRQGLATLLRGSP